MPKQPAINLAPVANDRVAKTTCYMCACRCGINVHFKGDHIRYIEGNRDHPVNKGVLCAKGSAGIMQHLSPARLHAPLMRVGKRGEGKFKTISWDEALDLAVSWLKPIRATAPEKLAFFTGRDQSQALTSWWAQQFGTPNYAAHGGFCSVNMAAAGIYTLGGAFWEFGSPDWDRSKLLLLFGVAEDHDSNPIKIGIGKMKSRGAKIISVNPVQTGYSAVADGWFGITPGSDGLFILSLVHVLLKSKQIDIDYLARHTNAPWLVIQNEGVRNHGLFLREDANDNSIGKPQMLNRATGKLMTADLPGLKAGETPALDGEVKLAGGGVAVPVFKLLSDAYLDDKYSPEATEARTGIAAKRVYDLAAELAHTAFQGAITVPQAWTDCNGVKHKETVGRPVAMHAMRGISAHSNGFQTCRALHVLQLLLGSVETPGGFRFKPPYPKPASLHPRPAGKVGQVKANTPLPGALLGYPLAPKDLLVDATGTPLRIDKAYSWEAPLAAHGLMHMVIANAAAGDPYPIDTLFMYMANMAWNSSMNTKEVMEMLTATDPDTEEYKIPHIIYSDSYASEMVAYADLILPDTTYLERHDCISLLDRPICEADAVADAIRHPVVKPGRDVRGFQSVLLDLGGRLGLPGMVDDEGKPLYADYADYIVNHQRKPNLGPLAGWRGEDGKAAGKGGVNKKQLDTYIKNGGFWQKEIPEEARFYKHANAGYQDFAVAMGFYDAPAPYRFQLYSEELQKFRLAGLGHKVTEDTPLPPKHLRQQISTCFTPLPIWYPPFADQQQKNGDAESYPLHALSQRPMAMYHSWGSQNPWLRQLHSHNSLYVPVAVAEAMGLKDGEWVWVESPHARIKAPIAIMHAVNASTVWTWNAIGKRRGSWQLHPHAPEANKGFLLNHLLSELLPPQPDGMRWMNSDPITGQAAWYDLRVRLVKLGKHEAKAPDPDFVPLAMPPGLPSPPKHVCYGEKGEQP